MAAKTRRSSTRLPEKEVKKEEVEEVSDDEDDEDRPPPILERETSKYKICKFSPKNSEKKFFFSLFFQF